MRRRLNCVFFGVCFLAALFAEAYSIFVLKGELLNFLGFGVVSLLTGYLLFAEIRDSIERKQEKLSVYVNQIVTNEMDDWKSRMTELTNIQKATYAATKKSNELLNNQLKEISGRVNTLESNNSSALYLIAELQRRSLEGQKKAINYQVHYNRENTKELISAVQSLGDKMDVDGKINRILNLLEQNDEILKRTYSDGPSYELIEENNDFQDEVAVAHEELIGSYEEPKQSSYTEEDTYQEEKVTVTPLYDDPNKALSADEIAALFESYNH